jgi:hypothetical protein
MRSMKESDNYKAKLRLWIEAAPAAPIAAAPRMEGLPWFGHRRFDSYAQLNAWKRELIREIAARGGCQWTN